MVKRPAIVVRRSTERPEVVGSFATLVPSLVDLPARGGQLLARLDTFIARLAAFPSPYGDGQASARCVHHIALVAERLVENVSGDYDLARGLRRA